MTNSSKEIEVSHLLSIECTACGEIIDPKKLHGLCKCGKVLFANYDAEAAKETVTKDSFNQRRYNIWRIPEMMPVLKEKYRFSLGEGWTPLLQLNNLEKKIGLKYLMLKNESDNPTGTFKSRGLCAAVSKAYELGAREFVIPTAGNAGAALAAYAAKTKTKAHVFMPKETPPLIIKEVSALGAEYELVDGIITDAGKKSKEKAEEFNCFDVSTLKEP